MLVFILPENNVMNYDGLRRYVKNRIVLTKTLLLKFIKKSQSIQKVPCEQA